MQVEDIHPDKHILLIDMQNNLRIQQRKLFLRRRKAASTRRKQ